MRSRALSLALTLLFVLAGPSVLRAQEHAQEPGAPLAKKLGPHAEKILKLVRAVK